MKTNEGKGEEKITIRDVKTNEGKRGEEKKGTYIKKKGKRWEPEEGKWIVHGKEEKVYKKGRKEDRNRRRKVDSRENVGEYI